jgi:hypothetical protein
VQYDAFGVHMLQPFASALQPIEHCIRSYPSPAALHDTAVSPAHFTNAAGASHETATHAFGVPPTVPSRSQYGCVGSLHVPSEQSSGFVFVHPTTTNAANSNFIA